MEAFEVLTNYYNSYDEDSRLLSRHGSVEFLTTVRYIEKYLRSGMKILEIGAGTGRYSHLFAHKGYTVDAVELIEHNIEKFKINTLPDETVTITQGNAVDLSFIAQNTYDITLLLGPMYHLFADEDKKKALSEALRVTKPNGLLYVAYCMNEATIIQFGFQRGGILKEPYKTLINPITFKASSTPDEIFTLYRKEEIDALISDLKVSRLHFLGTDMFTNYNREMIDNMDDSLFELYLKYHFAICERADLTGMSYHTLDILRKE
ncbi:MAG TPA: class I SAM-dependent methyltransferase [Oscillospiraceae bacterium]|nr:class I SAM-dependent methyltransferase [Oscillospiraceae bacterium]HPF55740.1 class I SAM-dependent methyltransferase [Clostridiales bacterium]HPK34263.1 class I SAM-dependent methyltransferase [Oscillospiraceae bacterium]HPR74834.1 class I SAM-dependent methyltransferase [Oscillospiraceae bacterium]